MGVAPESAYVPQMERKWFKGLVSREPSVYRYFQDLAAGKVKLEDVLGDLQDLGLSESNAKRAFSVYVRLTAGGNSMEVALGKVR